MNGTAGETRAAGQRVVVVGVDGSVNASAALQWAARDVEWLGGHLRIVCAWHSVREGASPGRSAGVTVKPRAEQAAASALELAIAAVAQPGLDVSGELVEGPASDALVAAAATLAADLLVVGARGLEGLRRISLGSVSSHCALNAPCPVVVVPAHWSRPGNLTPARLTLR